MNSEPRVEERPEQPYLGIRTVMPMRDFDRQIPSLTARVLKEIEALGLHPSGKPFLRYHVIDMPQRMDVEVGVPVAKTAGVHDAVESHVLPAGRYAVLGYRGVKNGMSANKKLLEWVGARGEAVVSHGSENGEVFKARYETFLTDAKAQPDQDKWDTEIAMKLRD